jgi:Mn-containing catalase
MSEPTFLPLLNSIAVNEAKGQKLLGAWAAATQDADLKAALTFVSIREGEHAMAFTKRMCELGHAVDETSAYQVFKNFDDLLACACSDATDAEKVEMLTRGETDADERGRERKDPFRNFFKDPSIDPQTGSLLGRFIAEERDSGRRLKAEYDRVRSQARSEARSGRKPAVDEIAALKACVSSLEAELKSLRKMIAAGR